MRRRFEQALERTSPRVGSGDTEVVAPALDDGAFYIAHERQAGHWLTPHVVLHRPAAAAVRSGQLTLAASSKRVRASSSACCASIAVPSASMRRHSSVSTWNG